VLSTSMLLYQVPPGDGTEGPKHTGGNNNNNNNNNNNKIKLTSEFCSTHITN
jgi:hypothetical protein